MTLLRVRPFASRDEADVIALWNLVFADDPPWNAPKSVIDSKMLTQPELFYVCTQEEKVVGTALAGFDGHRGWVHKVATDPRNRRQGVARLLMQAVEAGLRSKGCTKLNLQVRSGNDAAASFYRTLGFAEESRISLSKHIGGAGHAGQDAAGDPGEV